MGRTPYLGSHDPRASARAEPALLPHGVLRVYNRLGRRDNIYKARIKILVSSLGAEEFARQVEAEWAALDQGHPSTCRMELARIRGAFGSDPVRDPARALKRLSKPRRPADLALRPLRPQQCRAHKTPGYAIVNIVLKAPGETPGDATAEQMDVVADLAERFGHDDIRVTHAQNLVLPHVKLDDLPVVFAELQRHGLAGAQPRSRHRHHRLSGAGLLRPRQRPRHPIAKDIAARFAEPDLADDIGELKIKISGCINACGHHHVGHIGILGVDKKGEEFYQLSLGGSGAEDASLASILGPALRGRRQSGAGGGDTWWPPIAASASTGERFLDTYRRLGPRLSRRRSMPTLIRLEARESSPKSRTTLRHSLDG